MYNNTKWTSKQHDFNVVAFPDFVDISNIVIRNVWMLGVTIQKRASRGVAG